MQQRIFAWVSLGGSDLLTIASKLHLETYNIGDIEFLFFLARRRASWGTVRWRNSREDC